MRQFLLYAHTGRASALDALDRVARDLAITPVTPAVTAVQLAEIRAADPGIVPPGLLDFLESDDVRIVEGDSAAPETELCIVLGGDGTILRALEVTRPHDIPVHGVNLGHVGFLAESEVAELGTTVSRLIGGDYVIESRATLSVRIFDKDNTLVHRDWALNEASLEKADRQRMIFVVVGIDGRPVSEFGCDGVLLSTPTGSTAYAFSAGGPVMWPELDAMLMTPLAAHALFARPLVLGRSSEVEIELSTESPSRAIISMDGRRTYDVEPGDRVEADLSPRGVSFARFNETPFANRLVDKFQLPVEGWRGRDPEARYAEEKAGRGA